MTEQTSLLKPAAVQPLDAVTLKALAAEWCFMLAEARVAKLSHPSPYEFIITFWGGSTRDAKRELLYIHLNPEAPSVALLPANRRQAVTLNTFDKPTALCMLLRKQLNGAVFVTAKTLPGERVLDVIFENYNELGQRVRLVLSMELMGKHTNMILYDQETGVMLAVAHGVGEHMSRHREIAAGLPYAPPPFPSHKKLLPEISTDSWHAMLEAKPEKESVATLINRYIAGWGKDILNQTVQHIEQKSSPLIETEKHFASSLYNTMLALETGSMIVPGVGETSENRRIFTLLAPEKNPDSLQIQSSESKGETSVSRWLHFNSVNDMLGDYYPRWWNETRLHRKRERLLAQLSRFSEKLTRRQQDLSAEDPADIDHWQATGDRLLAAYSSGEVPTRGTDGQTEIHLPSYEQAYGSLSTGDNEIDSAWVITLDPALNWVENAHRYYRQAKKAKARQELHRQMRIPLTHAQEYLGSLRQLVTQADTLSELLDIETELDPSLLVPNLGDALLSEDDALEELPEISYSRANHPGQSAKKGNSKTRNASKQHDKHKTQNKKNAKASKKSSSKDENFLPSGVSRFQSSEGVDILLGKTSKGNDSIVGKLSRSEDWWLHAHLMPGSHILIRSGAAEVSNQTLEDAAMLAAYFSSGRNSLNVPIVYTQSKFVRKIPHSYPGHVNYRQEKTIFITPDLERLSSLPGF